jgi:hypothetical protein
MPYLAANAAFAVSCAAICCESVEIRASSRVVNAPASPVVSSCARRWSAIHALSRSRSRSGAASASSWSTSRLIVAARARVSRASSR